MVIFEQSNAMLIDVGSATPWQSKHNSPRKMKKRKEEATRSVETQRDGECGRLSDWGIISLFAESPLPQNARQKLAHGIDKKKIEKEKKEEKEEKKKEPEPNFEILQNPARVLRQQLKVVTVNENSQYIPMKDVSIGGIIMVRNLKPGEEELVEPVQGTIFLNGSVLTLSNRTKPNCCW